MEQSNNPLDELRRLYEAGAMSKETFEQAARALGVVAEYKTEAKEGSTIAQGPGATAVGPGGVNVSGTVHGSIYTGSPTDDPAEALRIYRQVLLSGSANLPLRGVDVGAGDPATAKQLGLANVYIDLDTTTLVATDFKDGVFYSPDGKRALPGVSYKQVPLTALQAVAEQRCLVFTGEPGGGKSTFVNHLSYCLAAHALYPDAGWLDHLPDWPTAEATLLPIPVTLRDFTATIDSGKRKATPSDLWRFITARLEDQNLGFAALAIEGELRHGRAIILLDGLDEVTGDDHRAFVRDAVATFADRYPRNRFLVTCRILAYQPPDDPDEPDLRLDMEKFPVFELAPFDEEKIDRFLAAWYAELARLGSVRTQDVDELVDRLRTAVRRPDLWRMAPNPLLLTVMALVHAHQGRLPDARALLYEQTVDMLLWRWEEVKLAGQTATPTLRQLLQEAGRAELDLKRVLWRLAYEAHGRSGDGDDSLGDIAEAQLTRALVRRKPDDWQWAHELVAAMKQRAGLLLERSPGVFTFPHRTFQEYLAGAHLSTQSECARQAAELGAEGALWREAVLLAAGRLVHVSGDVDRALALVNRLCPERRRDGEAGWRNAWLAGDALREIGLQRAREDEWGRELLERTRHRLADLVSRGQLTPRERADAGNTLAELSDPRPGVGVRVVNGRSVPDIELCYVPPGPFWMGSPEDDADAGDDEKPLHQVDIPYGYWIGRYPVTVAQWRAFCEMTGYAPRDADSLRGTSNHPAIWITWYDALEFGRRLTATGHEEGWLLPGWRIALPSEAEWEKAARGGLRMPPGIVMARLGDRLPAIVEPHLSINPSPQRRYPWGDEPAGPERANYEVTGIGRESPVGAFPGGSGPYGALDLSGNVWEWTRSRNAGYPYDVNDGREAVDTIQDSDWLGIRGGASYGEESWLRCAYRLRYGPYFGYVSVGFRVIVSPFLPPLPSDDSDL